MGIIKLEKTRTTPYLLFDPEEGKLVIEGRSSPENSLEFYTPVIDQLKSNQASEFVIDFKLEYFNTSTSKCLFIIFQHLGEMNANGSKVTVNWYADEDDYDLIETGEDFEEMTDLKFNFVLVD